MFAIFGRTPPPPASSLPPRRARNRGHCSPLNTLGHTRPPGGHSPHGRCQRSRGEPSQQLRLHLSHEFARALDSYGVCRDALWRMSAPGLPDRWMRLWGGRQSLFALLQRYSFFDASGCAYSADSRQAMVRNAAERAPDVGRGPARGAYAARCRPCTQFRHAVPCHVPVRNVGVAQLSARSGICWWGPLWFAVYFNTACRAVLDAAVARMPDGPASAVLRERWPTPRADGRVWTGRGTGRVS